MRRRGVLRRLLIILLIIFLGVGSYFGTGFLINKLNVKGYETLFVAERPYELVIKYAQILDGSGVNNRFRGDIAIRDGIIVGVGYVNAKNSPVFDAGGLTVVPWSIPLEKGPGLVEHPFIGSFPHYPAESIILQEPPYQGFSLLEAANSRGVSPDEMFRLLKGTTDTADIVLLAPFEFGAQTPTTRELVARLTGYRAEVSGMKGVGQIKAGFKADFYFFKTGDYNDEALNRLLAAGSLPPPLSRVKEGKFLQ